MPFLRGAVGSEKRLALGGADQIAGSRKCGGVEAWPIPPLGAPVEEAPNAVADVAIKPCSRQFPHCPRRVTPVTAQTPETALKLAEVE